jgi:threonine dehydratase
MPDADRTQALQPIGPSEVEAAAERIGGRTRLTPVSEMEPGAFSGGGVTLKLELLQHTGSFKPRGMFNKVLSSDVPAAGLVAASGGNAGLAVAYVARALGLKAAVFVPKSSPPVKVARIREYGAELHQEGESYADALAAAEHHGETTGALRVHAYDQPEVVAGQGTLGRELEEQVPGLDTVLVAVGGGGLVAGIAGWFTGRARVVAVEPERCATYGSALAEGGPVDVEVGGRAADSLGARRIGAWCWAARGWVAGSVLVSDADIERAQRRLWEQCRIIAEPGAVTALAALVSGAYVPGGSERVVAVISGANTDPQFVNR